MSYWPEKETGVGVAMKGDGSISAISAFGFKTLYNGMISHNEKRSIDVFEKRVKTKNWLEIWPNLKLNI